jgi:sugar transferase EpsL
MTKRILDLVAAVVGLSILSPLLLLIALLVRITHGVPVLFTQMRPGLSGEPFRMYKFRTMTNERAPDDSLRPDEQRMTKLGRLLRATSLDELPELVNVLKGDMSLVGPRPLLMEYLPLYSAEQARRHEVRPGITGWAQVNGRNGLAWEERFKLDIWYVDNSSLSLDLRILWMTLVKVLRREGISEQGRETMSRFTGNGMTDE